MPIFFASVITGAAYLPFCDGSTQPFTILTSACVGRGTGTGSDRSMLARRANDERRTTDARTRRVDGEIRRERSEIVIARHGVAAHHGVRQPKHALGHERPRRARHAAVHLSRFHQLRGDLHRVRDVPLERSPLLDASQRAR